MAIRDDLNKMNIRDIANKAFLTLSFESDANVSNLRYAADASEDDLAVIQNSDEVKSTKSKILLMEPNLIQTDKLILFCDYGNLYGAVVRIADILYPKYGQKPTYKMQNGYYISDNVTIDNDVYIAPMVTIGRNVFIGTGTVIEPHVCIGDNCIIGQNCYIHAGAKIGADSFLHYLEKGKAKCFRGIGRTVLGNNVQIGYNSVIQKGTLADTTLGDNVLIGNLVIVAHDVHIGKNSRMVCQSGIAGKSKLGDRVLIMGQSGVIDNIKIGNDSIILAKSVATKNIKAGSKISGIYGREHSEELKIQSFVRHKYRRS